MKKEKEIDWAKIPKWTKVQVRDNDNEVWRNRYFIGLNDNNFKYDYPFVASLFDEFVHDGSDSDNACYRQCRIHESVNILEDWYVEERI